MKNDGKSKLDLSKINLGDYVILETGEIITLDDLDIIFVDDEVMDLEEAWDSGAIVEIRSPSRSISVFDRISETANNNCCLCVTFRDFLQMDQAEFIETMKANYYTICDYPLTKGKVKSWRDEYNQIKRTFIPVFQEYDDDILDFHIVFELQLLLDPKDLDLHKYVYADMVIVGDDGFVVLEFKQRDTKVVEHYWREPLKYVHRLRYHKVGRHQSNRYAYIVCTKETEDGIWYYKDKKDFWYGNPKSVAEDLCSQFFDNNEPCEDIERWLNAGFREKRR